MNSLDGGVKPTITSIENDLEGVVIQVSEKFF